MGLIFIPSFDFIKVNHHKMDGALLILLHFLDSLSCFIQFQKKKTPAKMPRSSPKIAYFLQNATSLKLASLGIIMTHMISVFHLFGPRQRLWPSLISLIVIPIVVSGLSSRCSITFRLTHDIFLPYLCCSILLNLW